MAGEQFHPCHHLACGTYDDDNNQALGANSDAIAFTMLTLAYSSKSVNGVAGQAVPGANGLGLPSEFAGRTTGQWRGCAGAASMS